MKNLTRLSEIEKIIASLTKEYATAVDARKKEIIWHYNTLNQEHCNLRATAYKNK